MPDDNEYSDDYIAELFYYAHRVCTPTWQIVKAPFHAVDLTYVVAGSGRYILDGASYNVKAGDLIYVPRGTIREAMTFEDDLMELYSTNFQLKNLNGRDVELPFPRISSIGIHQDIISLYNDLNNDYYRREPGYHMKLRGWMQFILHRYMELIVYDSSSAAIDSRINRVLRYITKHYPEKLSIRLLSQKFGLSRSYFGVLFTRAAGMPFRRYLMKVRLNAAEDMLLSGEYSATAAASACGFTDPFYFSKAFKASRGTTPSSIIPAVPHISQHIPGSQPEELEVSST